jgi:hypothetical protein
MQDQTAQRDAVADASQANDDDEEIKEDNTRKIKNVVKSNP